MPKGPRFFVWGLPGGGRNCLNRFLLSASNHGLNVTKGGTRLKPNLAVAKGPGGLYFLPQRALAGERTWDTGIFAKQAAQGLEPRGYEMDGAAKGRAKTALSVKAIKNTLAEQTKQRAHSGLRNRPRRQKAATRKQKGPHMALATLAGLPALQGGSPQNRPRRTPSSPRPQSPRGPWATAQGPGCPAAPR